jgi:hypothetical protein
MKHILTLFVFAACALAASSDRPAQVRLERVPNGGIQPQVAVAADGTVHLVYFSGDPMAGDLFYLRSTDGGAGFSKPIRVNSHPGSAIAVGNIRGEHIALGRNGRVHVAWNGSKEAEPKGTNGATPMLYTRLNDAGTAFEPERNVIRNAYGLDGGGALAADQKGNVYVFWHAPAPGTKGEANRGVWVARSTDDGKTFAAETSATNQPTGACGCCGMKAMATPGGDVFALYRSATDTVNRDMYLLASKDGGRTFSDQKIDAWEVGYCVMSSAALTTGHGSTLAAWETKGQIHFGRIDPTTNKIGRIFSAPGDDNKRKHPAMAANANGQTILAWTDGMAWKKGGSLAWQVYDASLQPAGETGHADGVPVWSLLAAFARPDGGFTILY